MNKKKSTKLENILALVDKECGHAIGELLYQYCEKALDALHKDWVAIEESNVSTPNKDTMLNVIIRKEIGVHNAYASIGSLESLALKPLRENTNVPTYTND